MDILWTEVDADAFALAYIIVVEGEPADEDLVEELMAIFAEGREDVLQLPDEHSRVVRLRAGRASGGLPFLSSPCNILYYAESLE